jgi:predicted acylesterase/phospholipase RssA
MTQSKNPTVRRGLVLEGGGAKGAWQFGALQALDEAGMKFDYVAGTSVGALNGALWATGCLDLGKELWASLSSSKIFKLRMYHSPMFLIGLFARTFYAYVKGFISPDAAPLSLRIILYGFMGAPTVVAAIYLLFMHINLFSAAVTNGSVSLPQLGPRINRDFGFVG